MGSSRPPTKITDLDDDVLAHCARYLSVGDISNIAIAFKSLKRAAYSDSVWTHYFRERWPNEPILGLGMRDAFLAKQVDLLKLKFKDPLSVEIHEDKGFEHILLDRDYVYLSQGSRIWKTQVHNLPNGGAYYSYANLSDHKARITCMRSFPLPETSFVRSESKRNDYMLLTSSSDHTIRLWGKLASCQRCFKGHNGPVTTLSDKLLGDGNGNIFASGGEDATVRLWSLTASGKRREPSLQATLCGHEKPIKFLSVAGHKTTLLASISNDSKVKVWDAASASSSGRSFCCVGMTSVQGTAVSMECHESLLYIAAGSSVVSIDLRTMQKANTIAVSHPKVNSFAMLPTTPLFCTGGDGKAMLWDTRKNSSQPVTEMVGHRGRITQLHMDQYKIVTGGPDDVDVNVWETNTGEKANSFECCDKARVYHTTLSAMAVQGLKLVTCGGLRYIYIRDFRTATLPVSKSQGESSSKFWKGNEERSDSNDDSDHGEVD